MLGIPIDHQTLVSWLFFCSAFIFILFVCSFVLLFFSRLAIQRCLLITRDAIYFCFRSALARQATPTARVRPTISVVRTDRVAVWSRSSATEPATAPTAGTKDLSAVSWVSFDFFLFLCFYYRPAPTNSWAHARPRLRRRRRRGRSFFWVLVWFCLVPVARWAEECALRLSARFQLHEKRRHRADGFKRNFTSRFGCK